MGDETRFEVLTEYIFHNFPNVRKIADVAGGMFGHLNISLTKCGYDVTTIDPRFGYRDYNCYGMGVPYHENMASAFDLIVGLHPDGATESIVYSANFKPIIIVPCCNHWEGERYGRYKRNIVLTIRNYLEENDIQFEEGKLLMSGANEYFRTF